MTLAKAIEIMQLNLEAGRKKMPYDTAKALSLVVEASLLLLNHRRSRPSANLTLLPGETGD